MKIAIIGSGIAGMGAAWLLNKDHDVHLYEKDCRIGGHTNTVECSVKDQTVSVDTGFIVYNEPNYPNLTELFRLLKIDTHTTEMGFAFSTDGGKLEWSGNNLSTLFAQKRNLVNPTFLRMVRDIVSFNNRAAHDLASGSTDGHNLREYLEQAGMSQSFGENYLQPMAAAIWSTSCEDILDFPASSFIAFFRNHGLLNTITARPQWKTCIGGSINYARKIIDSLNNPVRLGKHVIGVCPLPDNKVSVRTEDGAEDVFDHVLLASHSDQSLDMLSRPSELHRDILGSIHYAPNKAYLHLDEALMPIRKTVWSCWNYLHETGANGPASVSYWMNALQSLPCETPLFVTLNPLRAPRDEMIIEEFDYHHPQFTLTARKAQNRLTEIQGKDNIWFAGAWTGYGFHEDGLRSGIRVAQALGAELPWNERPLPYSEHVN